MYELRIVSQLAAAHQLREYGGKCERLHGHNWKIEVYVTGKQVGEDGLLMDFRVIKDATKKILDQLDHRFLNEIDYFKDINPSSENIARYIYDYLGKHLNNERVRISKVSAWESNSACATYSGP